MPPRTVVRRFCEFASVTALALIAGCSTPERKAPPTPPPPVQNAVRLMWVGAAISAISLIVTLATVSSLRTAIHNADPTLSATKLHSAETAAVVLAVAFGLIGIGLWVWMALANKAGKNWARITATVFFGLDTLSLLPAISRDGFIMLKPAGEHWWLYKRMR